MNLDKYFEQPDGDFLDAVGLRRVGPRTNELIDAQEEFSDDADCEGCKI